MSARNRLRANDARFISVAEMLTADQWSAPSLCSEWTNHEVLAHLVVGYSCGMGSLAAHMYRGGGFDAANTALARACAAARSPDRLLAELRTLTDRPAGIGRYFPARLLIGDHVTHELDILYALDVEPRIPTDVLVAVLAAQVSLPNPFVPAYRNSRGLRLVATDADWAHGDGGPLVEARAAELISVLGNRAAMVPRLRGAGTGILAGRVLSPRTGG
ncbi:maleylpyruvate isomerase family mycothiol-dependent enzyme [Mycobacterium sp. 48b]|uniref:maleylpyruvate isomerase family mycothiol-dependent enzyme n=1 Tax=Mycobacterium sp. 48b TaxID=3400426 RepID=UPI003AAD9921